MGGDDDLLLTRNCLPMKVISALVGRLTAYTKDMSLLIWQMVPVQGKASPTAEIEIRSAAIFLYSVLLFATRSP